MRQTIILTREDAEMILRTLAELKIKHLALIAPIQTLLAAKFAAPEDPYDD